MMNFYQRVFINGIALRYMISRKEAHPSQQNVFNLVVTHGLYFFSAVCQVVCVNKPVLDIMQRTEQ
jgi:hypothetical protein